MRQIILNSRELSFLRLSVKYEVFVIHFEIIFLRVQC
jgi:hypothetical protein